MVETVKFGTESEVSYDGDKTSQVRIDKHNGGETRRLRIIEESIRVDDKRSILNKVMEYWGKFERGEVVGFSVDASIYKPQTFQVDRIVVKTINLIPKSNKDGA